MKWVEEIKQFFRDDHVNICFLMLFECNSMDAICPIYFYLGRGITVSAIQSRAVNKLTISRECISKSLVGPQLRFYPHCSSCCYCSPVMFFKYWQICYIQRNVNLFWRTDPIRNQIGVVIHPVTVDARFVWTELEPSVLNTDVMNYVEMKLTSDFLINS